MINHMVRYMEGNNIDRINCYDIGDVSKQKEPDWSGAIKSNNKCKPAIKRQIKVFAGNSITELVTRINANEKIVNNIINIQYKFPRQANRNSIYYALVYYEIIE